MEKLEVIADLSNFEAEVVELFRRTFTASEGESEGAIVGGLAEALLTTTGKADLYGFASQSGEQIRAAALFSKLAYSQDARSVFILSPMAVAPEFQGKGHGQALITHALSHLRNTGVDVAITYGDPAFYGKLGFKPLDPARVAPPHPLSLPIGWIGQSLNGKDLGPVNGSCSCVPALDNPAIW